MRGPFHWVFERRHDCCSTGVVQQHVGESAPATGAGDLPVSTSRRDPLTESRKDEPCFLSAQQMRDRHVTKDRSGGFLAQQASEERECNMRIYVMSVLVDDQAKALNFYTEKLGFIVKHDIPLGAHRWLTVVSKEAPEGT